MVPTSEPSVLEVQYQHRQGVNDDLNQDAGEQFVFFDGYHEQGRGLHCGDLGVGHQGNEQVVRGMVTHPQVDPATEQCDHGDKCAEEQQRQDVWNRAVGPGLGVEQVG